ncbi:MAG: hypothetical protein N0A03_04235 [Anaerolineae bacterium]|nr:hypothetical protein [Anaerolineae bacterium]
MDGAAGLYYVVTAQNAAGESGPSNTAQARGLWPLAGGRGPGLPLLKPDPLLLLPAPLALLALGRSRRRLRGAAPVGAVLLVVAVVCAGAGLLSGGAEAAVEGSAGAEVQGSRRAEARGSGGAEEVVTRVITYILRFAQDRLYDPLHRLTGAQYSTGERFEYAYDAVGNVTVMTETVGATVVTRYTYNPANQLLTAHSSRDGITWHYTFDRRGNLIRQTPGGTAPAEGETRYTYDAAGHLVRVELYTGGAYVALAEAAYNADDQRLWG